MDGRTTNELSLVLLPTDCFETPVTYGLQS